MTKALTYVAINVTVTGSTGTTRILLSFGNYAAGTVVSKTYDQRHRRGYVNGELQRTQASTNHHRAAKAGE